MECSRVLCDPTPARDRWHCVRGGQVAGGLLPCATHVWCFADRWSTSGELAPSFLLPLASHTAREEHLFPLVTSILISLVSGTQIIQREREGKKERISEIILMQRPFQVITSHSRLKKKKLSWNVDFSFIYSYFGGAGFRTEVTVEDLQIYTSTLAAQRCLSDSVLYSIVLSKIYRGRWNIKPTAAFVYQTLFS